jgi:RNA polymerase sigma factor (TIGR02999 family)
MKPSADITELLIDWRNGNQEALDKLFPLVEEKLNRLAKFYLRQLKPGDTLQTTAIVNETYLHLIKHDQIEWQNRAHFFGIAATVMRQFLLNYIRDAKAQKRGGNRFRVELTKDVAITQPKSDKIIALDEALNKLAELDARKAKVVELKYFGGMTLPEIAEVLKISEMTVIRDWNFAKAWLANILS